MALALNNLKRVDIPLKTKKPNLWLQCTCFTVPTNSRRPHRSPLSSQPLSSLQLSHNDSLWAEGITKSHREQCLDYREAEELSWCPSWLNSLWQGWSYWLVHCPGENAIDPIWRVLASSRIISSWTLLKPQHSIPCWLSVMPVLSEKGIIKSLWVDLLCLAFLGLGEPACFHWELCLLVSGS